MQPDFTTDRLLLRPASDRSRDELWALWTNPKVRQFLWDDVVIERERAAETIRDLQGFAGNGLGLWTIVRREEPGDLIGCAALSPVGTAAKYYPPFADAVECLIALYPAFWHQGYALEALSLLVSYARETLKLERLVGVTDVPNIASDRLLRRAGFVPCAETDGPRYRLRHYTLADHGAPRSSERPGARPR